MASGQDISQIYNAFHHLLKDLEPFVNVTEMHLAFDKDGNVSLIAPDFTEPLKADPKLHRLVREEMRQVIAKYRSIHSDPFAIQQDNS
ncbi:hypothetical protein GFS31_08340 [Leptolyngbya sp. BL0902]|uniref:hypothetical protein n=1 Tax=Leptolyngbya sp. BL0902 TaxID=1115757 RepID=UPI0018E9036F|nr:hypothetical protein [Leptolyngbya sp. BL0902]QQE64155.1 hypothetical protein GFS31_08340 [Leptolyngbya sp. BL0902]